MAHSVEVQSTVDAIRSLPWVAYIGRTDRDDATHRIESHLSAIRMDHEVHDLQNLGIETVCFSAATDNGSRIYVEV